LNLGTIHKTACSFATIATLAPGLDGDGLPVWDLPHVFGPLSTEWALSRHDNRRTGAHQPNVGLVLLFDTSSRGQITEAPGDLLDGTYEQVVSVPHCVDPKSVDVRVAVDDLVHVPIRRRVVVAVVELGEDDVPAVDQFACFRKRLAHPKTP
jgi:hypothetical protein